jgi:hypothetical protein
MERVGMGAPVFLLPLIPAKAGMRGTQGTLRTIA